jgi:hypothetical protein
MFVRRAIVPYALGNRDGSYQMVAVTVEEKSACGSNPSGNHLETSLMIQLRGPNYLP